jgi:hypothetical protein
MLRKELKRHKSEKSQTAETATTVHLLPSDQNHAPQIVEQTYSLDKITLPAGVQLVSDRQLEPMFCFSRAWYQLARSKRFGPPYYRVGGKCLYDVAEVLLWFKSERITPSNEPHPGVGTIETGNNK